MRTEIEAKLKVDSIDRVAAGLELVGAEFVHQLIQTDYYFDDAEKSLTKADSCLRLRCESAGNTEKIFLTFKGPREKTTFKKRQEIEIEVKDADSTEKLLLALGYVKALVFEKRRQLWRLGDCEIALDELPLLGEFVEIEGLDERTIENVRKKLKLEEFPHIPDSYATLMANELDRQGIQKREVFFQE